MRIRVLLLPNLMILTVVVASAILLCYSTSCLGSPYEVCPWYTFPCGGISLGYPFGELGKNCGDPDFQVECDLNDDQRFRPLINIGGDEYHILQWSKGDRSLKIVNDNLYRPKCSVSGNYSQFWLSGSHFRILNTYKNLTLWKCREISMNNQEILSFCGEEWSYSSSSPLNPACEEFHELPIPKIITPPFNNETLYNGFEVTYQVDQTRSRSCDGCLDSKGRCGYNSSELNPTFLCYCQDGTSRPDNCSANGTQDRGSGRSMSAIIIGCSVGGVALIAIAVGLLLTFYTKRRKTRSRGLASDDMEAAVLPRREISNLPTFSYEELRQATNCFNEENEVGDGGFGSVYLGKLRDGRTVAVKRLYQDNSRRLEQFINEVQIFSTLNHPRVVRLYGCSSADSPELLLVYEFVSNGTLADHLHGDRRKPRGLPWNIRLNIAIQTAEALAFLHSVDPPIFHRDVKSSNILLDENFNVKVADFGLCRLVPVNASHVTTAPQGTPGYVDPEYHQCFQLTEKSDVYSFGVVLVEIISAKLAVDINRNRREINLANMAKSKIQEGALHELVDPQLEIEMNHEVKVTVSAVAELAFRCLASERDERPHMKEVVSQLEEIRKSWDTSTGPVEQQWGSFSDIKEPLSPISVQDKWSRHKVQNLSSKE